MESALEPIIRPTHQEITNVADYVSALEINLAPIVLARKM